MTKASKRDLCSAKPIAFAKINGEFTGLSFCSLRLQSIAAHGAETELFFNMGQGRGCGIAPH
jgi:hypothetical protein